MNPLKMTNRDRIELIDEDLYSWRYNALFSEMARALTDDTYTGSAEHVYCVLCREKLDHHQTTRIILTLRRLADKAERRHEGTIGKKNEPEAKADATFCASRFYCAKMKLAEIYRGKADEADENGDAKTAESYRTYAANLKKTAQHYKAENRYLITEQEYYFPGF